MKKPIFIRFISLALVIPLTLLVLAQPVSATEPTVVTVSSANVTTSTATLSGNLTDWGTAELIVAVYFEYGLSSENYSENTTVQEMSAVGAFGANITGLSSGTTYYFRAVAVGDGISYGDELFFTTLAPPTVATLAATNVTTTAATLNGNLTDWGTASVQVSFAYWVTVDYSSTTSTREFVEEGTFSANITGLSSGTTYYFCAVGLGDSLYSGYGSILTFTTESLPAPAEPAAPVSPPWREPEVETITVSDITANSATLYGNLIDLGTAPDVAAYFKYGLTRAYDITTPHREMSDTGEYEITIGDLSPGTIYHFRAFAKGEGYNYGADMTFTTLEPPTVETSAATGVTNNAATLNGNLLDLGTADNITVSFEYGLTTDYGNTTPAQVMDATGTFSANITGLSPETTYYFRTIAVGDGTSYGDNKTFTTLKVLKVNIKGKTVANIPITADGLVTSNVTAVAPDGSLSLEIPENTYALNKMGECLTNITVDLMAAPPKDINILGPVYDFSPRGATFDPPIMLTIKYDPTQLPYKVTEESLYISFFDGNKWVPLKSVIAPATDTVTIQVSHFSRFALMYELLRILSIYGLKVEPEEVEPAEPVDIYLLAGNAGNCPGTFDVVLKINGVEEESKQVALDPDEQQVVTFSVVKAEATDYTVDINGLSASYVVKEKQAPTPPLPVEKVDFQTVVLTIALIVAGIMITSALVYFLVIRRPI